MIGGITFMKFPNQKHFKINRNNPLALGAEKKQFVALYTENVAAASRNISGEVAFKLYLYLAANADNYEFDFSPQHFANIYGVSIDAAKKAVQKLIDAGYLTPSKKYKNSYEFYEIPQEKPASIKYIPEEQELRLIPQDDDSFKPMTYIEVYRELIKDNTPVKDIEAFWNRMEVVR